MNRIYKKPKRMDILSIDCERIFVDQITDNKKGFNLMCGTDGPKETQFEVHFDSVHSYRNSDEGERHDFWKSIGGYLKSGLYEATSTDFSEWVKKQYVDQELPDGLCNYIFVSCHDVIDILSFDEPKIRMKTDL